jgi:hypothetical protein
MTRTVRTAVTMTFRSAMMIAGTVRSLLAFLPFLVARFLVGAALAIAWSAAESLAHRGALFVVELAVTVFIELFQPPLVHGFASGLSLFVAEFSVTVLIVVFEHPLAHFAARWAFFFAAVVWRLGPCRGGYHAGCENES